jgi:hypothetical protein
MATGAAGRAGAPATAPAAMPMRMHSTSSSALSRFCVSTQSVAPSRIRAGRIPASFSAIEQCAPVVVIKCASLATSTNCQISDPRTPLGRSPSEIALTLHHPLHCPHSTTRRAQPHSVRSRPTSGHVHIMFRNQGKAAFRWKGACRTRPAGSRTHSPLYATQQGLAGSRHPGRVTKFIHLTIKEPADRKPPHAGSPRSASHEQCVIPKVQS